MINASRPLMPMALRARTLIRSALWNASIVPVLLCAAGTLHAQKLPESLTDAEYWRIISDFSEPDGFFRSDNFVSNEWNYQVVIPELNRIIRPGAVYMGVGPDQNYTYIAALKPAMAFIVDIRRQNLIQHLMYKALMETSDNRAAYLTKLFSRVRPPGLTDSTPAMELFDAVWRAPRELKLYEENLAAIREVLVTRHGFKLSDNDLRSLEYVFATFYNIGPGITYQGSGGTPTFWDLMVETDGAGVNRSYMASEANYRVLRQMHLKNLIVPIVGDFAGPKAIRQVGGYLADKQATVGTFYLSNVEQYLFQYDSYGSFYRNAATLPLDSNSTFIRSAFNNQAGVRTMDGRPRSLLASMQEQLRAFGEGRLTSYAQVISTSR